MSLRYRTIALLTLAAPLAASGQQAVAITNVSVIPMDRERILTGQTVVVQGNRITAVGPAAQVTVPEGATRIDGAGKFLIPGLAELHAHLPGGQNPAALERVLELFILNGVTTIRSMLGDTAHLRLRAEIARGSRMGPRIVAAGGPSFNGQTAATPQAAMQLVQAQKAAGYDLLKIHPGVTRIAFDSLAAVANRLRIPFSGHVPLAVGIERAIEARYHTIDHIDGFLEAIIRDGAPVTSQQSQLFGANLVAHLDESKIAPLARRVRESGVGIVPTEGFLVALFGSLPAESLLTRPELRYWFPNQVNAWGNQKRNIDAQYSAADRARFLELRRKAIKALHDAGVTLLLGSDAPQL
ncbi:MAG TPA: amidohydrolase family protein, partial [Gemmatimonadaceae bacterium]